MNDKEIFFKHLKGYSYRQLAVEYKCSHQTIAICCRRFSKHKQLSLIMSLIEDYPEHTETFINDWEKYLSVGHFYSNRNLNMISKFTHPLLEEIVHE